MSDKITNVSQIPQIKYPNYNVCWPVSYLPDKIKEWQKEYRLELNPEFQRGHVWTLKQKILYVEFLFKGGKTPTPILFNCPNWTSQTDKDAPMVVLDGLQRITAIQEFYEDKFKIFGSYASEIEGVRRMGLRMLDIGVYDFTKESDILEVYLQLNAGGTQHTKKEIDRVQALFDKAKKAELSVLASKVLGA